MPNFIAHNPFIFAEPKLSKEHLRLKCKLIRECKKPYSYCEFDINNISIMYKNSANAKLFVFMTLHIDQNMWPFVMYNIYYSIHIDTIYDLLYQKPENRDRYWLDNVNVWRAAGKLMW